MSAKKQNGRQITKLSITHSVIWLQSPDFAWKFVWTVRTNLDFFLELQSPNFAWKLVWIVRNFFEKQNGRQIAKLSITRSFLELQSPDFAWKFVWTVWTNFDKQNGCQKTKWPPKNKMAAKSLNFQARSLKFRMEVYLDHSQPKTAKLNCRQKTKWPPNRSIFNLEAWNFAWKYILTTCN